METQNEVCLASASSSPSRCSIDSMFFYSAPTSPTRRLSSNALLGNQTEPTSPRTYDDSNSNLDDFEFDTSCHFNHIDMTSKQVFESPVNHRSRQEMQHKERGDSLPTLAFADELFCDGKVMPLSPPLKLPPSLSFRGRDDNGNGYRSYTTASSPRSPRSVLRLPLSRQCLWNDNFDPFVAALENVSEEKRDKTQANNNHRRARSMSPLRVTAQKKSNGSMDLSNRIGPEGPIQLLGFNPNDQTVSAPISQSPKIWAEPKGLVIARQLEKNPMKPDTTSVVPGPKVEETSEVGGESGERKRRVSKRQRLKRFLLRSLSSSGKVNDENKAKNENVGSRKPSFMRRFNSFRSEEQTQNCNGEEMVSNVAKVALVHYKPSFSICFGYRTT